MPATAEEKSITLHTANPSDQIALRALRLTSRVKGLCARSTLEQTFVNLEDRPIEALYAFPLPDNSAVCGFEVVFFDHVFTGAVEEIDRAIEQYDDALAAGHGAYLLEQHRPDVFSVRVGNLKPRQAVTIRISWLQDVQVVDRQIRLAFPTTLSPRYTTATGTDPIDAAIDADTLNPPHVLSVPYGLSMEVEIDLPGVAAVTSPSHAIAFSPSPGTPGEGRGEGLHESRVTKQITLREPLTQTNRDIVLTISLAADQQPFALATTAKNENFIALNFIPEFDHDELDTRPTTTLFLLDCSGSMEGESIAQAAAALECCLRAMNEGDHFNICRFGSTYELLAPQPLTYSHNTLQSALNFIRQGGNLGGTELLPPLETLLNASTGAGITNIVLLTDGQVSNEPAILALARRKRSRNRIFTFGIGHGASHFLVNGLARVTGGAAEFITPGERIEDKVLRTFGRLASPPVTDVEIDFHTTDADIAPRTLGPIFDGDALRVFAKIPGSKLPERVTLRCNTPAGPRAWTVNVQPSADADNALPTLWARSMIREIEDASDGVLTSGSMPTAPDNQRLIHLSKTYNLTCSQTAFIALEHRSIEDRTTGQPALRRVPIQLTKNWGGVDTGTGMAAMAAPSAAPCPPPHPRISPPASPGVRYSLRCCVARASEVVSTDPLITLLSLQDADGHFRDHPLITQLLPTRAQLESTLKKQFTTAEQVTTLLVLHLLETQFKDRHPTWKRAAKKAMTWLTRDHNKSEVESALKSLGGR